MDPFPRVTKKDLLNPERYKDLSCPIATWDGVINPRSEIGNQGPARQAGCHENEYFALREFALKSPTIIDIGANIGQSVIAFKNILPRAHVTSFEPNPFAFKTLCKTISGFSSCKAFNFGIGSEEETLKLWVPVISGHLITPLGTLIKENLHESPMREYIQNLAEGSAIELFMMEVHIKPLPTNFHNPDVVKIDAEGSEIDILKSLLMLLTSRPIFIIEKSNYREIIQLLGKNGYQSHGYSKVSGLYPLSMLESAEENMMPTNIIGIPDNGASLRFALPPNSERESLRHLASATPEKADLLNGSSRIALSGYFKYGNFGDELFLKIWTDAFSNHGIHPIPYGPFEAIDANIKGVVIGGGDLLSLGESAVTAFFSCATSGIPYVLSSVGIPLWQAIESEMHAVQSLQCFYEDIFANPSCLGASLRDLGSYEAAINAYPEISHKLSYSPDISFSLYDEKLFLERSRDKSSSNHIVIACRAEQPIEYDKQIAWLIDYALSCGKTVELFVQGSGLEGERDIAAAIGIIEMTESSSSEIGLHTSHSIEETFGYFSNVRGRLFSSKYHLCIAALMSNVPCYSISGSTKFIELYSDLGLREFLLDLDEVPRLVHAVHDKGGFPDIGRHLSRNKRLADLEVKKVTSLIASATGFSSKPCLLDMARDRLLELKRSTMFNG